MMRLFVGIELPEDVRAHLLEVQAVLRPSIEGTSWTRADNLHLTLKFLGEVDEKRLEALRDSLGRIRSSREIHLGAEKLECFPNRGAVRIIAAGLGGQVDALRAVQEAIEQRSRFLGFERETRTYRPHVTLARARLTLHPSTRSVVEDLCRDRWPGPEFAVGSFSVIQSRLKPSGSEHSAVARFPLRAE